METRFTDSFPSLSLSLQYYLYVSFSLCNFFRLLSFFFSPPSSAVAVLFVYWFGKAVERNVGLSLLSRPEPRSFSLTHYSKRRAGEEKTLVCVPGRFDPTSVRVRLLACLSLLHVPHGFHIDQTLPNFCRTTSLALSLSIVTKVLGIDQHSRLSSGRHGSRRMTYANVPSSSRTIKFSWWADGGWVFVRETKKN